MRLGWRGEQVLHGTFVYCHGSGHDVIADTFDLWGEPFGEVPIHDLAEDDSHCLVIKFVDGDGVEVSEETRGNGVTPTTWGAHGSNQQYIHKVDLQDNKQYSYGGGGGGGFLLSH